MGIRCLQSWEASLEVDVEERFQSHALQLVRGNHDQIWTSSVASPASSVLKWDHSLLLNNTDLKQKPEEKKTRTVSSRSRIPVLDSTHDGFTTQICTIGPHCSHKRMWDFLIKIRNLCPQQTNIPWVGYLCVLPLTAWQSTTAVPFLKPITDAVAENMSASSKAS